MTQKITTVAGAVLAAAIAFYGISQNIPVDHKILRVIDGDTVEFEANFLPDPLDKKLSLRILGVDTPEDHFAKCDKEKELAKKATEYVKKKIADSKEVLIRIEDWDKFGGRVIGDLLLDGRKLSKILIDKGHAVEYNGSGPKKDWCSDE